MAPNPSIPNAAAAAPTGDRQSDSHVTTNFLKRCSRRFLAVNPFYWASAALLLYGVNQVSSDPHLVGAEFAQLAFNFSSMLVYELLVVLTAIWLARRAIWSDAVLLVVLENVFALIPFSLISRAAFLSTTLTCVMCVSASVMACFKLWAFKQFIPQLNLPKQLLQCGAPLLVVNAAWPLFFRALEGNRFGLGLALSVNWFAVLPSLASFGKFLPAPSKNDSPYRWVALGSYAIWIAVTAGHLGGLGFVHGAVWDFSLLAPTLWVIAWTAWRQRNDYTTRAAWHQTALFLPALASLFAIERSAIFAALNGLNILIYAHVWIHDRSHRWALPLSLASLIALLAGLPQSWLEPVLSHISRTQWIGICFCVGLAVLTFFSKDPRLGLLGAISSVLGALWLFRNASSDNVAIQFGFVFLLLHSFRWQDEHQNGAKALRLLAMLGWIAHSFLTVQQGHRNEGRVTMVFALLILIVCGITRLVTGRWGPSWIGVATLTVLFARPVVEVARVLMTASVGFLAVATSFVLFALGTVFAFTRHRFAKPDPPPSIHVRENSALPHHS